MLDKRITLIIIILGFFAIPFISAEDNLTLVDDVGSDVISLPDESSYSNIYFNASVENDGSGTQESPYKYLTSDRIKSNSILYLANGEYELDKSVSFSSFNAFIGENAENTIIKYSGTAFSNSKVLELYNLTIKGASVYNKGTLTVDNVVFRDSTQDYGGTIYSVSSTLNILNSRFINNTARLGGAICDLKSQVFIFNMTAINNTAIYQGGAIYKMYGALYLNSSEFINNSANEGQAIFCDYSTFNMTSTNFKNNGVYSILCDEDFTDNTFNQSELHQSDYYDINFVSQNYTPMIYVPYNGTIPSRYDLREEGMVTPVKNQGSNGNCWAFAILAALESCILKASGTEYDLSEQNMKNLMALYSDYGWNYQTNNGGTNEMALAYLTGWIGAINESDDRYVINSLLSPVMDSTIHVQNIIYLPRMSYTDNDAIKQAILNYGGVYTTLYAVGNLYQYYTGTNQRDHAVEIVGWDDNFPKSKFRSTPPGDGAWICKNSWGSSWGDGGYFYVSYYDASFAMVGDLEASFTFILNDTVKYDKVYQWEIAGVTDYFLTEQSTIWYQNYYNATSDDILAAFSTYFYMESNWTAEVYVNDELRLTQDGFAPARGYYTFNFDEFIPVHKDDEFKILLKVTTSDEAYVPISENNGYVSRVHFKENISFISYDGINWIDFYSYNITMESRGHWYESQVACLKAFTIFNLTTVTILDVLSKQENNFNISATVLDQYGHLINEGYVIFEFNGIEYNRSISNGKAILSLCDLEYGYSNISAAYQGNTYYLYSRDELTFNCNHDVNLTLNIEDISYGDYLKANITLMNLNSTLINANLTLTIADKTYNVSSNSIFVIPDLINAGDYEVKVIYGGNYTYSKAEAVSNVTVKKVDVNFTFNVNNIDYGDYLAINTALSFKSTLINDELILTINNESYSFTANSEFILPVLLNASQYCLTIYYNGSNNFNANNINTNVFVSKACPVLTINISDIDYGDDLVVYASLMGINGELINENVSIIINNVNCSFVANSEHVLPVLLNASNYTAYVIYDGDSNYYSVNETADFKVSKVYPVLDVSINDVDYGDDLVVYVSLIGINGDLINENVSLVINDFNCSFVANNEFVLSLLLNASNYTVNVIYGGDSNFNSINMSVDFKVSKACPVLDVSIDDVNYGENVVVDVSLIGINGDLMNKCVVLRINNVDYSFVANSLYTLPVILNASNYASSVSYEGDSNYCSVNESVNFTVNKNDLIMDLLILNNTYGEITTVNTYLYDLDGNNLTSELLLVIDDNVFEIMSNSAFTLPVLLNASNYTAELYFNGSNNYNANNISKTFSVSKSDVDLYLSIEDITYGEYLAVENTLSIDIGCDLQLDIDNESYMIKPNSIFSLSYFINAGNYEAVLIFKGNDNYNANIQRANVNVDKFTPTLISNISDIDYGDDLVVYTSLIGINSELINESLVLIINDINCSFIANNEFVLPVLLNASNYTSNIIYGGDSNYYSVNETADFKVSKVYPVLDVSINDVDYGDDLVVYVSLIGINGDLMNKSVVLRINNVNYYFVANSLYTLPVILNASNYTAYVIYGGDSNYYSVNESADFKVSKVYPVLDVSINDVDYGDDLVVYASLIGINGDLMNKSVVLRINNVDYYFVANSLYTLPVILNASNYASSVSYEGDSNYCSVNESVNFTVNKNDLIMDLLILNNTYGEITTVNTYLYDLDGNNLTSELLLVIDDNVFEIMSNSVYKLPVLLNASDYTAQLYFNGSNNYNAKNISKIFTIVKSDVNLSLTIEDITYGEYLAIENTLSIDIGCDLQLDIDNESYTIKPNSIFNLPYFINAGNYEVVLIFKGNDNYNANIQKANVNVDKFTPTLISNISDIDYGDDLVVDVSLIGINGDLINENVSLIINYINCSFIANNEFVLPVLLNASDYTANVIYGGDSNYYSVNESIDFKVSKVYPILDATIDDLVVFASLIGINGELINESLLLVINDVNYSFMANSKFNIPVILNVSNYTADIIYNEDINYYSVNESVNFTVSKKYSILEVNISDIDYGDDLVVYASLTGINGELINESVVLGINGVDYSFVANSIYTLPVLLNASDYIANVIYGGDSSYYSTNEIVNFSVFKVNPVFDINVHDISYGDNLIVYASLTGINGELINENISLVISDFNCSFMANSEFVLPVILNASDYTAELYFKGNNNYNANNVSKIFSVSKSDVNLSLSIENITYGEYLTVENTLSIDIDCDLQLDIDNESYSIKPNSIFKLPYFINAGNHEVILEFKGSNNYNANIKKTNVSIDKFAPELISNVSNIDYGEYISVNVELMGINGSRLMDENITLIIDNLNYTFKSNANFTVPELLNASNYVVNVAFNGDNNYDAVESTVNVTVNKANPELTLIISNTLYANVLIIGNSLIGVNDEISNESLYLTVDGKTYILTSNVDFILPDILDVGNYTVNIIFNGNNNYNEAIDIKDLEIMPVKLSMDLNISEILNNASIHVKFSDKVNESVSVKVNEDTYNINTVNGEGILTLSNLDLGNYSVEASFDKTGYESILIKDSFNVTSINTLINVNNVTMYYHDGTRLYFNLTDSNNHALSNKSVIIIINNVTYTRITDVNGVASINLGLNSGKYLTTLIFDGDDTYISSSSSANVDIRSTINSNDLTKYYRNASQFYAKVLDYEGNPVANTPVIMNINGVFYNRTTNQEGIVRLNINLNPEKYILTIYNPVTNEMGSSTINVLSKLVENHDLVKYYKNASKYSVKVLDDSGSPLAGVSVTFNINGVFYTRTSDENGVVSIAINLNPGKYIITAEYDTLKVSNNIEVLSVIETQDITMHYRDGTSFKAMILDGIGNPNSGVNVTFNINGVFYTKTTDSSGVASLNINLQAGEYIITSTYNGLNESNTIVIKNL